VLIDRDGVINELCRVDGGVPDSPRCGDEVVLRRGAARAVRRLNDLGIPCAIVSNQPGIAKGKLTRRSLRDVTRAITSQLRESRAAVDHIYYCVHHPDSVVGGLRRQCRNRKPAEGLLLRAMRDFAAVPADTWMIGDTSNDLLAGRAASCNTAWVRGSGAATPPASLMSEVQMVGDDLDHIISSILPAPRRGVPENGQALPAHAHLVRRGRTSVG